MEENKEVKKSWFADKRDKFLDFCRRHPEGCLTVLGGLFTVTAGAMKLYAAKTEYEDEVYMVQNDKVYKLPAKQLQSQKVADLK